MRNTPFMALIMATMALFCPVMGDLSADDAIVAYGRSSLTTQITTYIDGIATGTSEATSEGRHYATIEVGFANSICRYECDRPPALCWKFLEQISEKKYVIFGDPGQKFKVEIITPISEYPFARVQILDIEFPDPPPESESADLADIPEEDQEPILLPTEEQPRDAETGSPLYEWIRSHKIVREDRELANRWADAIEKEIEIAREALNLEQARETIKGLRYRIFSRKANLRWDAVLEGVEEFWSNVETIPEYIAQLEDLIKGLRVEE